jgi:hypothetical protein
MEHGSDGGAQDFLSGVNCYKKLTWERSGWVDFAGKSSRVLKHARLANFAHVLGAPVRGAESVGSAPYRQRNCPEITASLHWQWCGKGSNYAHI